MNGRMVALVVTLLIGAVGTMPAVAGRHGNNHQDSRNERAQSRDSGEVGTDNDGGRRGRDNAVRVSMDEAVGQVLSAYGGQVVAASSVSDGRGVGYRIRVLQEGGRVRTVFVDANSGAIRE